MTGKETIKRTVDFKNLGCIPFNIGVSPQFVREKDPVKWDRIKQLQEESPNPIFERSNTRFSKDENKDGIRYCTDQWGTQWQDKGTGMFTTYHPMEEGYEHIDRVCFPDVNNTDVFHNAKTAFAARTDNYILGDVWFTLFERLWMLRGFTNMLIDPYTEEGNFLKLKERIMQVNMASIDKWLELDVDGIYFSDDWGTQQNLLINPDEWRRLYKNDYRRMFEKVRNAGKNVWMHLCGNITAILPDLIDIGLNVLNPVQPQAMDLAYLSRQFRGHVCFYGGIDVQGVMVNGTPEEVRAAVHKTIDLLSTPQGGYICSTSHSIMPETPLDNIIALLETITDYKYRGKK